MNALLLLLLDSRSPAGGHNHSAGMEAAVEAGLVRTPGDVEAFCRTRLRTSGRVGAAFAAAACRLALADTEQSRTPTTWTELDAELDARTPSEALRAASRQLGRGLLRLVRATVPEFAAPFATPHASAAPHHPLVLGAAVAAAGGDAELAARAAGLGAVSVPTSAAVRLLGLDPFAAHGVVARLAPDIDALAAELAAGTAVGTELPASSAPTFDLLADFHLTAEVRLFAS